MGQTKKNEEMQRLEAMLVNCITAADRPLQPIEVYQELINYLQKQQRHQEALEVVELALAQYPYASDFYSAKAQLLLLDNQLLNARRIIDRALSIHPGDFELQIMRSEVLIRMGQTSRGLAMLAPLKTSVSQQDLSDLLIVESLAYEQAQDYENMFDALKAALAANPDNEQALERLYACVRLEKRHEESLLIFEAVLEQNPYAANAWFYLGQSCASLGKNQRAIQAFEYAFLSQVDFEEAYDNYAELCIEEGLFTEAYHALEEMGSRFGTDGELYLRKAHCCYQLEQFETARKLLEDAARVDPHNDEVFFQIGACYAAQEKWNKAIPFFRKAIRMDANREDYYRALAESAFEKGDYELAEKAYREALELSPEEAHSWVELAWFLMDMLRVEEAREILEEANEVTFDSELTYGYIASVFASGQRQEALVLLTKALQEDYDSNVFLFEWQPNLRSDREVLALLSLYRPEEV